MSFSVLYTILVVLCVDVLAKDKDDSGPRKPRHTSENWMIYGPILVAILLIVSCVLSCKLRNWYRNGQSKRLNPEEEMKQTVVVAVIPETGDPLKETVSYRLLTPEYCPQTPQTLKSHLSTYSFPPQNITCNPQTPGFPPETASYRPLTTSSSDHRYLLVNNSGNVSQTTTLTRDGRA